LPSSSEKNKILKEFRPRFIKIVNSNITELGDLSKDEKKQVDELCKRNYDKLSF
jgi:hypothetical protein